MLKKILEELNLSEKEAAIYLTVLRSGPLSVREIADKSEINRGTSYDILKSLMNKGLVSYYEQRKKRRFIAENPEKILNYLNQQKEDIKKAETKIKKVLPQLEQLYLKSGHKPKIKFFSGSKEIHNLLQDIIDTLKEYPKEKRKYYVYSAKTVREFLYPAFPNFSEKRVEHKIKVKVIAIGEGGQTRGFDERKWIQDKDLTYETYTIIYAYKIAYISVDTLGKAIGILIEDRAITETQEFIFRKLWNKI